MKSSRILRTLCAFIALLGTSFAALPAQADDVDPALTQRVKDDEKVAPSGEKVEIEAGHVDMGPRLIDGKWELMVRDDTAGAPVWRHIDDVIFRVKDQAKMKVPEGKEYAFIGAKEAWVVPQSEVANVPWLGWNTQSPTVVEKINGGVDLTYGGHQGEGTFALFLQSGNFGAPQLLVNPENKTSQSIFVEPNTHTHANWVFTSAGVHLVKISATATLKDGSKVSDTKILRFAVGGSPDSSSDSTSSHGLSTLAEQAAKTEWTLTNDPGKAEVSTGADKAAGKAQSSNTESSVLPWIIGGAFVLAVIATAVFGVSARRRASLRRDELGEVE